MQLAKMNPRYLPAFIGLGLFLLAMLAACTAPSAVAVPTAEPTPLTISTELSNCVTLVVYSVSNHWHKGSTASDSSYYGNPNTSSSFLGLQDLRRPPPRPDFQPLLWQLHRLAIARKI